MHLRLPTITHVPAACTTRLMRHQPHAFAREPLSNSCAQANRIIDPSHGTADNPVFVVVVVGFIELQLVLLAGGFVVLDEPLHT